MKRPLSAILILAAFLVLALGLSWLADRPGRLVIDWMDWRIETSVPVLLGAILFLVAGVTGLYGIYRTVKDKSILSPKVRELHRQRRGLAALNRAIIALAAGDVSRADKLASSSRRLLPPQPMTRLIAAEAARAAGDVKRSREEYRALLDDPAAAGLGLRGLLAQALAEGRPKEALRLAREARSRNPKSPWAIEAEFSLLLETAAWDEALDRLKMAQKQGAITAEEGRQYRRTLLFMAGREDALAGRTDEAEKRFSAALKIAPAFEPAVAAAVNLDLRAGRKRKAAGRIRRAWKAAPHPYLLESFRRLAPGESPTEYLRRLDRLIETAPDHVESRLERARALIAAKHFDDARVLLDALLSDTTDSRARALMADLYSARGAPGDDDKAADFREQAREALRPPAWICSGCGKRETEWQARCGRCHAFDSFRWRQEDHRQSSAKFTSGTPLTMLSAGRMADQFSRVLGAPADDGEREAEEAGAFPPPPDLPLAD